MKNQHIETIRKACIKANPSITELKFGCRFFFKENNSPCVYLNTWKSYTYFMYGHPATPYLSHSIKTGEFEEIPLEIIGRPITLADVLLAISRSSNGRGYAVESDGTFMYSEDIYRNHWVSEYERWNLTKPLEQQSPNCLEFIANLLKHD